jgi:hypothetical protein
MRKSTLRLYLPFIGLAAVQALLIAFLPSTGANRTQLASGPAPGAVAGSTTGGAGTTGTGGAAGAGTGGSGVVGTTGTGTGGGLVGTTGAGGSGGSGSTGAGSTSGTTGQVETASGVVAGDISHCKGPKQFQIVVNADPPCVPKFTGTNPGATYQGVTKDTIKIVWFDSKPNPQVDAILATQGLSVPYPEHVLFRKLAFQFVAKHYELYGRKIDLQFVQGLCPTTPPNVDLCNADAQQVVKLHPFGVIWLTPLYASVFDIWARAGIVALGGWAFDDSFFNQRRPYRYDPWMNGTEVGANVSEYFCKKLAHHNADHTGAVIHPTIGTRGNVPRKLGIVTPEIEANVLAAKRVAAAVKACSGNDVPIFTYESDIERAGEQTQATVSGLIQAKITTVTCMCDPIAPAFLTSGMSGNSYFPEFLLAGTQFMDADLVGRLYDKQQMRHAFGISTIPQQLALDVQDPARVWQDMGRSGHACEKNGCGIDWSYVNMMATGLQMAGPNLTPLTFERGLLTMPADGGWEGHHRPDWGYWKLGQNDYTWLSDTREVYWSATSVSPVDGQQGAWIGVNGGKRYQLGQWGNDLAGVPVEPN